MIEIYKPFQIVSVFGKNAIIKEHCGWRGKAMHECKDPEYSIIIALRDGTLTSTVAGHSQMIPIESCSATK